MVLITLNSSQLRSFAISDTFLTPFDKANTFHCSPLIVLLSPLFRGEREKTALLERMISRILSHSIFFEDQFNSNCSEGMGMVLSGGGSSGSNAILPIFHPIIVKKPYSPYESGVFA